DVGALPVGVPAFDAGAPVLGCAVAPALFERFEVVALSTALTVVVHQTHATCGIKGERLGAGIATAGLRQRPGAGASAHTLERWAAVFVGGAQLLVVRTRWDGCRGAVFARRRRLATDSHVAHVIAVE